jgi:thiosulfate dehydrogenase
MIYSSHPFNFHHFEMTRALSLTFFALLACLVLLAAGRAARADTGGLVGDPIAGGRIYDNWMLALDLAPPAGNQPLWDNQDNNSRSGVITWRCVECHGWDYKGTSGAYGAYSSHYTGFTGLQNTVGATQEDVLAWLNGTRNSDHNFLGYTNLAALDDLAAFLRTQQVDVDLMIDPYTGEALGDRKEGAQIYNDTCASCHGIDGDEINFGTPLQPIFLGDLAVGDPWQALHKIRFGTPTTELMPSSEEMGWSLNRVADVLAYAQTLRRGNPDFDILTTNPNPALETERQGQIEPIIWTAFVIMGVILASVGWDSYKMSGIKLKLPRFKRSKSKK